MAIESRQRNQIKSANNSPTKLDFGSGSGSRSPLTTGSRSRHQALGYNSMSPFAWAEAEETKRNASVVNKRPKQLSSKEGIVKAIKIVLISAILVVCSLPCLQLESDLTEKQRSRYQSFSTFLNYMSSYSSSLVAGLNVP
jgi:hypothetical protein